MDTFKLSGGFMNFLGKLMDNLLIPLTFVVVLTFAIGAITIIAKSQKNMTKGIESCVMDKHCRLF